jgi:hypothetical protein
MTRDDELARQRKVTDELLKKKRGRTQAERLEEKAKRKREKREAV